jgi:hypothetical protein
MAEQITQLRVGPGSPRSASWTSATCGCLPGKGELHVVGKRREVPHRARALEAVRGT